MKTIVKSILILAVITGFVMLTAESEDITSQITWSLGWMAEMVASAWALVKMFPKDFKEEA